MRPDLRQIGGLATIDGARPLHRQTTGRHTDLRRLLSSARSSLIVVLLLLAASCDAVKVTSGTVSAENMNFEDGPQPNVVPAHWEDGEEFWETHGYTFRVDGGVRRSGKFSGRFRLEEGDRALAVQRLGPSTSVTDYAAAVQCVDLTESSGKNARLSGYLKTTDVKLTYPLVDPTNIPGAGLWLRADTADADEEVLANMDDRTLLGSIDWRRYEVRIMVPAGAHQMCFGIYLVGVGTVWVDDLVLRIA